MFKTIKNKKLSDYQLHEELIAGIVLLSQEAKSLFRGHGQLTSAFAQIKNQRVFLEGFEIFTEASAFYTPDPLRSKELLLKKAEIKKLIGKVKQRGFTITVSEIFLQNGKFKARIHLASGLKKYDKRELSKERSEKKTAAVAMKNLKVGK